MRVALYHPWVYLKSGIERMFVETVARSRHEWTIYTHHHEPESTYPELRGANVVELGPQVSVRREFAPLIHAALTMARTPTLDGDVLVVSSEGLGDLVMLRNRLPAIAYCHTPLKIVHDRATNAALMHLNPTKRLLTNLIGPAFTSVDRRMWRRFDRVLVNSEETRQRAAAARLRHPSSMEVLRPGVDLIKFVAPQGGRRERRFLVAGRIMWQKHIELAVDAMRILAATNMDATMVVAGAVDVKSEPYLAWLLERAQGLPIEFEPDPGDDRLAELYRTSVALVFTPRNEDWGMVPLEAMASRLPVLAVDAGGPRESVLHGRTGWLLPDDPAAFAERMAWVVAASDEEVEPMRELARQRAAEFGWEPFVARLDDVINEVASQARGRRRFSRAR